MTFLISPAARYGSGCPRRDLRVDVDAGSAEGRVVGLDVLGREGAMGGVAAGRLTLAARDERDRVRRARRGHLEPAVALAAIGEVGALLEPERAEVELERPVLVGHRDEHGPDLADPRQVCGVGHRFRCTVTARNASGRYQVFTGHVNRVRVTG
jgi:hypothetical protein